MLEKIGEWSKARVDLCNGQATNLPMCEQLRPGWPAVDKFLTLAAVSILILSVSCHFFPLMITFGLLSSFALKEVAALFPEKFCNLPQNNSIKI